MLLYLECFHSSKALISVAWRVRIVHRCKIAPPASKASVREMRPQAAEHIQRVIRSEAHQTCLCTFSRPWSRIAAACSMPSGVHESLSTGTPVMASKAGPHTLGKGPMRSRGCDSMPGTSAETWGTYPQDKKRPCKSSEGTTNLPPRAREAEVLSTPEERRPRFRITL